MSNVVMYSTDWFNRVQPLFTLQECGGPKLKTRPEVLETKKALQAAYEAGWKDCGEQVLKAMSIGD